MADYVDAAETSRAYLTARALGLASSQVLNALDIIDADDKASVNREDSFITIMNDTIDYVMKNEGVAPDDVTRFINNWTLKDEG